MSDAVSLDEASVSSPDTGPSMPEVSFTTAAADADISATLAEGIWALLIDDAVVDVLRRDPTGRFLPTTEVWDARDTPDVAVGWRRVNGRLVPPIAPPAPAPSRVISGVEFFALFFAPERWALWNADPDLMSGAMLVMTQNSANLDSPELKRLLALAEAKGVLTQARAVRIAAGLPPEAAGTVAAEAPPPEPDETLPAPAQTST